MNAPILITVYNRINHLKRCIESLIKCDLASSSILYISSDAACKESDRKIIEDVRNYIKSITGFKEVIYLFHEENKGLVRCFNESLNLIFRTSEKVIFLEDDIIVSPDFLQYMNDALDFYKDKKRIFSISGFSLSVFYPSLADNKESVYFTNRFNPWGFGIWRDRFISGGEYNLNDVMQSLRNQGFVRALNGIGEDLYPAFISQTVQNKMLLLDYLYVYHMVRNDLVTLTPYISRTFNIGNDGSGVRTQKNRKYTTVDLSFLDKKINYSFVEDIEGHIDNSFNAIGHSFKRNTLKIILYKLGALSFGIKVHRYLKGIPKHP